MERMELEGIVGPANHAGKREILVEEEEGRFLECGLRAGSAAYFHGKTISPLAQIAIKWPGGKTRGIDALNRDSKS